MTAKEGKQAVTEAVAATRPRLVPTQRRSRERFERILESAVELISEKGSEAFRMSDIVERAGVPFGSLYQYFPDKTAIIGTLAERYNTIERACVQRELAIMKTTEDLHPALCRIVEGYYRMYLDDPVMRDIWQAAQADRALQELDEEEGEFLAGLLRETLQRFTDAPAPAILAFSRLTMTLIAAAVRHAIALKPKEGQRVIALFKHMLPRDLSVLS
nr:TetR/AcrR family transcriptional regulator [Mesorhizobium alhagi]